MPLKIVVPSHKRHHIFSTNVEDMIVCVHESERKAYAGVIDAEIVTHNLTGLSRIRQWIVEKFADVFMIDDDIVSIESLSENVGPRVYKTPAEAREIIMSAYSMAKESGCFLFGFNNTANPKHYKPQKPFVANGYINASAFGIINGGGLYFDSRTIACESHWINLLNAHLNRKSFQDTRYVFRQKANSTFLLEGGQTNKRTIETEKCDTLFLKRVFGESVKLKKGQKDASLHHEFQRKLNIRL